MFEALSEKLLEVIPLHKLSYLAVEVTPMSIFHSFQIVKFVTLDFI